MAFWIFKNFLNQEIKSIFLRHGIRIIDTDIISCRHLQGIIQYSSFPTCTGTVNNGHVPASVFRKGLDSQTLLIGTIRAVICKEKQLHTIMRVIHIQNRLSSLSNDHIFIVGRYHNGYFRIIEKRARIHSKITVFQPELNR